MGKLNELPPSAVQHCIHCGHHPSGKRDPQSLAAPRVIPLEESRRDYLGGISRSTQYALIAEGKLVRVHIGRRAFITADSIDAYLKGLV